VAFQTFIDEMKLVDIGMHNGIFTWSNKRGGESQVASKLDRLIISKYLMLNDKEMVAGVLPFGCSDHWPIQMEVQGVGKPGNRPFRFENIWLSHLDFISNVTKWWSVEMRIELGGVGVILYIGNDTPDSICETFEGSSLTVWFD